MHLSILVSDLLLLNVCLPVCGTNGLPKSVRTASHVKHKLRYPQSPTRIKTNLRNVFNRFISPQNGWILSNKRSYQYLPRSTTQNSSSTLGANNTGQHLINDRKETTTRTQKQGKSRRTTNTKRLYVSQIVTKTHNQYSSIPEIGFWQIFMGHHTHPGGNPGRPDTTGNPSSIGFRDSSKQSYFKLTTTAPRMNRQTTSMPNILRNPFTTLTSRKRIDSYTTHGASSSVDVNWQQPSTIIFDTGNLGSDKTTTDGSETLVSDPTAGGGNGISESVVITTEAGGISGSGGMGPAGGVTGGPSGGGSKSKSNQKRGSIDIANVIESCKTGLPRFTQNCKRFRAMALQKKRSSAEKYSYQRATDTDKHEIIHKFKKLDKTRFETLIEGLTSERTKRSSNGCGHNYKFSAKLKILGCNGTAFIKCDDKCCSETLCRFQSNKYVIMSPEEIASDVGLIVLELQTEQLNKIDHKRIAQSGPPDITWEQLEAYIKSQMMNVGNPDASKVTSAHQTLMDNIDRIGTLTNVGGKDKIRKLLEKAKQRVSLKKFMELSKEYTKQKVEQATAYAIGKKFAHISEVVLSSSHIEKLNEEVKTLLTVELVGEGKKVIEKIEKSETTMQFHQTVQNATKWLIDLGQKLNDSKPRFFKKSETTINSLAVGDNFKITAILSMYQSSDRAKSLFAAAGFLRHFTESTKLITKTKSYSIFIGEKMDEIAGRCIAEATGLTDNCLATINLSNIAKKTCVKKVSQQIEADLKKCEENINHQMKNGTKYDENIIVQVKRINATLSRISKRSAKDQLSGLAIKEMKLKGFIKKIRDAQNKKLKAIKNLHIGLLILIIVVSLLVVALIIIHILTLTKKQKIEQEELPAPSVKEEKKGSKKDAKKDSKKKSSKEKAKPPKITLKSVEELLMPLETKSAIQVILKTEPTQDSEISQQLSLTGPDGEHLQQTQILSESKETPDQPHLLTQDTPPSTPVNNED